MPSMKKFLGDLGRAAIHGDDLKVEIMREAFERAKRAAGCPTGDPFEMTEEELANYHPSPEFVWRAAAELVKEHHGGPSERDTRTVEVLSPYRAKN